MDGNIKSCDFTYCSDKNKVFENYCNYMFTRTQSMFVYEGLPETIPVQWLEQYLQRNGSCCIAEVDGKLYALLGNAGGELDEYYQPTKYIVANPALNLTKDFTIGEDCVYCRNDYNALGLTPLISRYCGLMTENCLTVRLSDINMRMMSLLSAPDDTTLQSAKQYMKDLEDGKLGVVGEAPFFDGLKVQSKSIGNGDYMIQFIELQQYLKGSLYNELGINANFNMKREALSGQEVALNDDALMPLIDDMLKQRRAMCDELNEMFGLNVSVDYGSTWHSNVVEKQLIGQSELDANTDGSEELAGDESALPDDKDPNAVDEAGASGDEAGASGDDVSRLNTDGEEKPDDIDGEDAPADDDVDNVDETDADSETDRSDTDTAEHNDNTDDSEKPDDSENDESDSEECVKDQPEEEQTEEEKPEEEKPEDEKPEGEKKKKGEDEDET